MNNTKNYKTRLRLNRQIEFSEDFRKRFMTRDYGNYEKYEKNSIEQEKERGENDQGLDTLHRNEHNLNRRLATAEGDEIREHKKTEIKDYLTNE